MSPDRGFQVPGGLLSWVASGAREPEGVLGGGDRTLVLAWVPLAGLSRSSPWWCRADSAAEPAGVPTSPGPRRGEGPSCVPERWWGWPTVLGLRTPWQNHNQNLASQLSVQQLHLVGSSGLGVRELSAG